MKSQVEYVQATTEDIEQLINLRLAYINEDFGIIDKDQAIKIKNQLQLYFKKHIGKDCVIFTAKENENIIATAILVIIEKPANPRFLCGTTGEVLNVYTIPQKRHTGIATILMKMVIEYANNEKLDLVELKATKDGYNIYKSIGFRNKVKKYTEMEYSVKNDEN